jgi:YD repeat-containing protein
MGRLDHIVESGIGATTSYTYDTLDDLIGVIPPQGNQRGFTYNSLRRLTSATIPETGTSPSTTSGTSPTPTIAMATC